MILPRRRLLPVELVLLTYLAIITPLALIRAAARPVTLWVAGINLMIVLLVVLVGRVAERGPGRWLRELYPLGLIVALYSQVDLLNGFGVTVVHDAAVQGWEAALFGGQISREWWQAAPSRFWSTVLHGAYFAYYPIVATPPLVFLHRGDFGAARRAVCWTVTTYLLCYVGFLAFPVAGPYYEFPRPSGPFVDNIMARLVYGTLAQGSSYGAAFPSSHVAAALAATAAALVGSRRLGLFLALPTTLLLIGVVYCQMHYAIDAVAGAALATIVVAGGWWIEQKNPPSET